MLKASLLFGLFATVVSAQEISAVIDSLRARLDLIETYEADAHIKVRTS